MKLYGFEFLILFSLLTGCSTIQIKDTEWCVIGGMAGTKCFHTQTDEERHMTKEEWEMASFGWLAGSPESYGELKATIEKLCEETGKCSYEFEKKMKKFFEKVEKAKKELGE